MLAASQSPIERVSFVTFRWSSTPSKAKGSQSPIERVSFVTSSDFFYCPKLGIVAIPYRTGLICHRYGEPFYGDPLVGVWRCSCGEELFPKQVEQLMKEGRTKWLADGWACPACGEQMTYDEEV